jgi:hypothetical protein
MILLVEDHFLHSSFLNNRDRASANDLYLHGSYFWVFPVFYCNFWDHGMAKTAAGGTASAAAPGQAMLWSSTSATTSSYTIFSVRTMLLSLATWANKLISCYPAPSQASRPQQKRSWGQHAGAGIRGFSEELGVSRPIQHELQWSSAPEARQTHQTGIPRHSQWFHIWICAYRFAHAYAYTYAYSTDVSWLSNLHPLEHLDMSGVHLRVSADWVRTINTLQNLRVLYLSNCGLDSSALSLLHNNKPYGSWETSPLTQPF